MFPRFENTAEKCFLMAGNMRAHNSELRAADEQETKQGRKNKNKNRDIVKRTKKEKEEQAIQIDSR